MNEKFSITNLWKRRDLALLIIVAVLLILLFRQCNQTSNLKNQLSLQSLNIDALHDSIRIEKNKLGEETYLKKILLTDKENLEKLNSDLAKELKIAKGKVIALEKINANIASDTQYVNNTITLYTNGNYSLDWKFDTTYSQGNYRRFSGSSFFNIDTIYNKVNPGRTRINEDEIGFSFVTGIREKDKALEIFITPRYPNMKITNIEGAIIDPSKSSVLRMMFPRRKWNIGPYVGLGISAGSGFNGEFMIGPSLNIGIAVSWSWISF